MCVGGANSELQPVISGVPQGSVLGPLLFNFYINDISQVPLTAGTMSLYADDMMLYRVIRSQIDFLALQADVDCLSVWSDENRLNFNTAKCKYMVISRKKQPTLPSSSIVINNSPLTRVESYKYLGVWITCRLSWSLQVEEVCKKARRHIGVLYRKFYQHASNKTFLRLYLTYIRPHLEYAVAVWDPHQQGLINSLESVQRFALKASTRNWKASYDTLINICNVPTLEERRHCLKLSILYQIFNGHISIPSARVERRSLQRELRNSSSLMLNQRSAVHTNAHQYSFFPHTISLWNQLPSAVQSCPSLNTFKHSLLSLNV